jgi:ribosomal protein RSM22 (predicted rRNA methylase)
MTPPTLTAAIAALLEGVSRKDLGQRAGKLSSVYRDGGTSAGIATRADALAYLVTRCPATYAATRAAFARVTEAVPDFSPSGLLDVGAGPGTAAWAARDAWPSVDAITLIEPNAVFRDLAARLLPDGEIIPGDLGVAKPSADLVTASYVLAELPEAAAAFIARDLWGSATKMLVLVEPGTPAGFARIRAARAALIAAGGHVAAPCTHDNTCPMAGNDWCHFSERLPRSREHMIAKGARVPFEDERYAYVAVSRASVMPPGFARIIKPVVENKPGITLPLCDASGLRDQFIARRDKDLIRSARKKEWGDLF